MRDKRCCFPGEATHRSCTRSAYGQAGLVALDWKKAFDSINVESMLVALGRFGLPPKMLRMIRHIYEDREFRVVHDGGKSSCRRQRSGISQGCPLSPFLFVMLMSVITNDAISMLSAESQEQLVNGSLDVVFYADDTLIIGASQARLQELLESVAAVGWRYGMELDW